MPQSRCLPAYHTGGFCVQRIAILHCPELHCAAGLLTRISTPSRLASSTKTQTRSHSARTLCSPRPSACLCSNAAPSYGHDSCVTPPIVRGMSRCIKCPLLGHRHFPSWGPRDLPCNPVLRFLRMNHKVLHFALQHHSSFAQKFECVANAFAPHRHLLLSGCFKYLPGSCSIPSFCVAYNSTGVASRLLPPMHRTGTLTCP